jgi:hypothetical protein
MAAVGMALNTGGEGGNKNSGGSQDGARGRCVGLSGGRSRKKFEGADCAIIPPPVLGTLLLNPALLVARPMRCVVMEWV